MAKSAAERARDYRRRQREKNGTADVVLWGVSNESARTHGAYSADLPAAAAARLAGADVPDYLKRPVFAEAVEVAFRAVERASRVGEYVAGMDVAEAMKPTKAGSSSPIEIARQQDESAMRALGQLGLTPSTAAKFARRLADTARIDLALLMAQQQRDTA